MILFACCAFSFALGYAIGVIRVCRFVTKQLLNVTTNIQNLEKYSSELRQLYSRLGENDKTR